MSKYLLMVKILTKKFKTNNFLPLIIQSLAKKKEKIWFHQKFY